MANARILIVEDEYVVREELKSCLKELGHRVVAVASSGAEALRQVPVVRPDLVIVEIGLKGKIDGIDAAVEMRGRFGLPLIFLTAYADDHAMHRAKTVAPLGYLLRPFREQEVKAVIEMALYKHQLARQQQESEQWLALTLSSIGDALIATDCQSRVMFMNPMAERLTGWKCQEATGRHVDTVFQVRHSKTRSPDMHPLSLVPRSDEPGQTITEPMFLVCRDGSERSIDGSVNPLHNAAGERLGAVVVFRDVSERLCLTERLRQMHKMDAIGRLAGGVAHDFNNLLTVINGYAELGLQGMGPTHPLLHLLTEIRSAGVQAAALTRQLLTFSRKQPSLPIVFDLNPLVTNAETMLRRLIGEHIVLVSEIAPIPLQVKADPAQIEQVLLNLVINARDAMPEGGLVTVQTAAVTLDPARQGLPLEVTAGSYVELQVRDTGNGMTDEVLAHLFEPFFTTKEAGRGTGLGLAVVYGIVRQSQGYIEVASQPGEGTLFRIYLPRVGDIDTADETTGSGLRASQGSESILLVEDEPMLRKLTRTLLELQGYQVLEAEDGSSALRLCSAHQGPIHLLLTDMLLPGMHGQAVSTRALQLRPELKILYMSGYPGEILTDLGIPVSGVELLHKPFTSDDLVRRVRAALGH